MSLPTLVGFPTRPFSRHHLESRLCLKPYLERPDRIQGLRLLVAGNWRLFGGDCLENIFDMKTGDYPKLPNIWPAQLTKPSREESHFPHPGPIPTHIVRVLRAREQPLPTGKQGNSSGKIQGLCYGSITVLNPHFGSNGPRQVVNSPSKHHDNYLLSLMICACRRQ